MRKKTYLLVSSLLGFLFLSGCAKDSVNSNEIKSGESIEEIKVEATVESIESYIDEIGDVNDDSGKLIDAISESFSKLSLEDKKKVKNVNLLWNAQKEYAIRDGFVQGEFDENNVIHTFGVMSDLHNSSNVPIALNIMESWDLGRGIDALVMAGDLTDGVRYYQTGANEINKFKNLILNNVPDDLPIVMTLGNHDSSNGSFTSLFYENLGPRFFSNIDDQELAKTKGLSHSIVSGYDFICLEGNFEDVANEGISKDAESYLAEQMEAIVNRPDYDGRFIFIVTHLVPHGTLEPSSNSTKINEILRYYPQAVVIAGHSHYSVHSPLSIDQNRFTTFNPGSVSWLNCGSDYVQSNASGVITGEGYNSYNLPNGIIMEIDKYGNMRLNKLDLRMEDLIIDEPWIISSPKANNSHLCSYTKDRADDKNNPAPYFENDACRVFGSSKQSSVSPSKKDVTLTIDAAVDETFIHSYSFTLYNDNGSKISEGKALSEFYLYCQKETMPDMCKFTVSGLSEIPTEISIKPIDCFGREGKAVKATISYI